MKRHPRFWTFTVLLGLCSLSALGHAALSAPSAAQVGFQCSGPAGLKIEGTTSELDVKEEGGNIVIDVPLANLTTGIGLRDRHMKEKYLEVQKYPTAALTIARSALKFPAAGERAEGDVPASMKLHGETRTVSLHYDAKGDGRSFSAHGKFRINMNEFGITVPTYLGVTVKPDVDVSASFRVAMN